MKWTFKSSVGDVFVFGPGGTEAWYAALDEVNRRYRVLEAMPTGDDTIMDNAIHSCKRHVVQKAKLYEKRH